MEICSRIIKLRLSANRYRGDRNIVRTAVRLDLKQKRRYDDDTSNTLSSKSPTAVRRKRDKSPANVHAEGPRRGHEQRTIADGRSTELHRTVVTTLAIWLGSARKQNDSTKTNGSQDDDYDEDENRGGEKERGGRRRMVE